MNQPSNIPLGIALMVAATFVFSVQDALSRHLASTYNVWMVVMIRYWFFAAFVIALARRRHGSVRQVAATRQLLLQIARGLLLAAEICVSVIAYTLLGLVESHAVFVCYPLIVVALSGPLLGERIGWRRWAAVSAGFAGVLVILAPGGGVFDPLAVLPLAAAGMFAFYGVLNRLAARHDTAATSFFWTGIVGALVMTVIGAGFWQPMTPPDWGWMIALSLAGILGHWLFIRCYEVAEASAVQPFAYLQLVFASALGITIFGEDLRSNVVIGAAVIVAAGLFTLWRERRQRV